MKKILKMASMAIGVAALFAGCSRSMDDQSESMLREMNARSSRSMDDQYESMVHEMNASIGVPEKNINAAIKQFKEMTPEQKEKEFKKTKALYDRMK